MAWEVFSFIGTAAFAISGALVAMEEKYDIFGVYILGIVTEFGGGALRNVLLGIPSSVLLSQHFLFIVAPRIPAPSSSRGQALSDGHFSIRCHAWIPSFLA